MAAPFKLKSGNASSFKNMGSSPAKQVKENFNFTGDSKSTTPGHSTTKIAKTTNKGLPKNFNITGDKASTTPKYNTPKTSKVVKALKNTQQILKKAGKIIAPIGIATTLYDFYKSGQKHSGGKVNKGQKSFMSDAKKNTKSIFKK